MRKLDAIIENMTFVIIHGAFSTPQRNWFLQLKDNLESIGQQVYLPTFPVDTWDKLTKDHKDGLTNQNLDNWLAEFEKILPNLRGKKLCFIGHSLGPLFILHLVNKYNLQLDCAIFVSPFLSDISGDWHFYAVNKTFYKTDFDWQKLQKLIPTSYVLYADNDPYVPQQFSIEFAEKIKSSLVLVKKAGHMNSEVNLNEFPLVYELCKSRIDLSLYQRYLEYRNNLYMFDHSKAKYEEVIYIDPTEVFTEGSFKFKNLRKGGFCTFFTALKFWDTQARYYQEARQAAHRIPLTRVFVISQISDLNRENLNNQIKLDLENNIKVFLVMNEDIKDKIPTPDFGIWDDEYVCIIGFDDNNKIKGIKLSSRKEDLKKALVWQKIITNHAKRIKKLSDTKKFIADYS